MQILRVDTSLLMEMSLIAEEHSTISWKDLLESLKTSKAILKITPEYFLH